MTIRAADPAVADLALVVDGRSLDRHVCEDGSEAWFEVSRLVGA